MRGWQPSSEQAAAVRQAANVLRTHQHPMWADDMTQAGLIALWRHGKNAFAYTVARRAMIDEIRVLHQRTGRDRSNAVHVPIEDWDGAHCHSPDRIAACNQALRMIESSLGDQAGEGRLKAPMRERLGAYL